MSEQTPTNRQNPMTNKQSVEEEILSFFETHHWANAEGQPDYHSPIDLHIEQLKSKLQVYKQAIREEMLEQVDEFKSQIQFMSDDIGFHSETSRKLCDRIKQQLKQE